VDIFKIDLLSAGATGNPLTALNGAPGVAGRAA
jgi:hypothetical protein